MILFYSTYCPHCTMLLDTIKRSNKADLFKLVCIEMLRSRGQQVPVTNVPTLVTLPDKHMYTGKAVFDYLLLPGSGKLLTAMNNAASTSQGQSGAGSGPSPNSSVGTNQLGDDPIAFSMTGASFADTYTDVNHVGSTIESNAGETNYVTPWTTLTAQDVEPLSASQFTPEETRNKKESIDLDAFKMKRDMDLQAGNALPPPVVGHNLPTFSRNM